MKHFALRHPGFARAASLIAAAALCSAVSVANAQTTAGVVIPRTVDGHPDFQGIWSSQWLTPVERPAGVTALNLDEAAARQLTADILARKPDLVLVDDGVVKVLNVEDSPPVAEKSSAETLCSMIDRSL